MAPTKAHAARDRLRLLRSRWGAERAAETRRADAEAGFPADRREALTRQLADARNMAADAVAALDGAAREALVAVGAYTALVRQVSGELVAAGLRAGEGGPDGGGTGGVVHLGGEVWRPADGGALLDSVMQAAVAAGDARHPLAQLRWAQLGGLAEKAARDELLARAVER
ncbi:hypothetical protein [Streptomyces sp. Tu102]|uniref:hypothetical protein n=1 Tax=Streptomyces sp. Tu102 TaxID=2838019 RepID=UPI001BDCA25E|nr:hypothetical protein [Streptomyces sp. Tu102]MBT1098326.1 hypothetical protein [Streptomyces sp. Tu102]